MGETLKKWAGRAADYLVKNRAVRRVAEMAKTVGKLLKDIKELRTSLFKGAKAIAAPVGRLLKPVGSLIKFLSSAAIITAVGPVVAAARVLRDL